MVEIHMNIDFKNQHRKWRLFWYRYDIRIVDILGSIVPIQVEPSIGLEWEACRTDFGLNKEFSRLKTREFILSNWNN